MDDIKVPEAWRFRRCHSLANVIRNQDTDDKGKGKKTDSLEKLMSSFLINNIKNDPAFKAKLDALYGSSHTAAQEGTAAINELSSTIIDFGKPNSIGRSIVHVIETSRESVKIRKPEKAVARKTGRGKKTTSRGLTNTYETVTPTLYFEDSESWDQTFVEDTDWNVMAEETAEVVRSVSELESQTLIDIIEAITAANLASGGLISATTGGTLSWTDICNLWGAVADENFLPDAFFAKNTQLADLFKEEEFTNSLMLGDFVDLSVGKFGKTILGAQALGSSLVTATEITMLDSTKVLHYVLRRDEMLRTWEDEKDDEFGVAVSTRYGTQLGRENAAARSEDV